MDEEDACAINRSTSDLMMATYKNNNFDACRNKRKFQDEILEELPVAKHTCLCLDISSAKDSNSFSDDADSVMSDAPLSTSSSVNWSGTTEETKTFDAISASSVYQEEEDSEFSSSMEDLFCSNALISNNSVLSSGRWNVNQDAEQETQKLTIDKEFEQYFSMLML